MEFRLVKNWYNSDGFIINCFEVNLHGKNPCRTKLVVAAVVKLPNQITDDDLGINYETNSNQTVLKVIHKNNKGYFINMRKGSGYSATTERVYLTAEEEQQLLAYYERAKAKYENTMINN